MSNQLLIENYYRAHRTQLHQLVSARIHDAVAAEDIVHDAFLRLLTGNRPLTEDTLPSLVYTLCRNLMIDWYRRHSVRRESPIELLRSKGSGDSAESLLSVRDITEQMERGLTRLPDSCRELYRLHVYGGLQTRELAACTGQNYKTVEYRLGLARKEVRSYLRHIS
jgi:RNA polymerase sigma-70 factor (ECF subfamily)